MRIGFLGAKVLAQFGVFDEENDMTEVKNAEGVLKKLRKEDVLGLLDELQQVRLDLEAGKTPTGQGANDAGEAGA